MYFLGCLVDHEDNSKRWCSTKVDSNNNHIANQNEYGYCEDDCPKSNGEDIIIDDPNSTAPNNGEGIPHDHDSVPNNGEVVPHDKGEGITHDPESVPHSEEGISHDESVSNIGEGIPHDHDSVPHDHDNGEGIPDDHESVLHMHSEEGIPHDDESVPHSGEGIPHDDESVPHSGEEIPHDDESVPDSGEEIPHDDEKDDWIPYDPYYESVPSNQVGLPHECTLEVDIGPCRAYVHRYCFDSQTGKCKQFGYGGCKGNQNNFKSKDECEKKCLIASNNSDTNNDLWVVKSKLEDWDPKHNESGYWTLMKHFSSPTSNGSNGGKWIHWEKWSPHNEDFNENPNVLHDRLEWISLQPTHNASGYWALVHQWVPYDEFLHIYHPYHNKSNEGYWIFLKEWIPYDYNPYQIPGVLTDQEKSNPNFNVSGYWAITKKWIPAQFIDLHPTTDYKGKWKQEKKWISYSENDQLKRNPDVFHHRKEYEKLQPNNNSTGYWALVMQWIPKLYGSNQGHWIYLKEWTPFENLINEVSTSITANGPHEHLWTSKKIKLENWNPKHNESGYWTFRKHYSPGSSAKNGSNDGKWIYWKKWSLHNENFNENPNVLHDRLDWISLQPSHNASGYWTLVNQWVPYDEFLHIYHPYHNKSNVGYWIYLKKWIPYDENVHGIPGVLTDQDKLNPNFNASGYMTKVLKWVLLGKDWVSPQNESNTKGRWMRKEKWISYSENDQLKGNPDLLPNPKDIEKWHPTNDSTGYWTLCMQWSAHHYGSNQGHWIYMKKWVTWNSYPIVTTTPKTTTCKY